MSRETFVARVNEVIALIRADDSLSPGLRRALWLALFNLADKFNALSGAGGFRPGDRLTRRKSPVPPGERAFTHFLKR